MKLWHRRSCSSVCWTLVRIGAKVSRPTSQSLHTFSRWSSRRHGISWRIIRDTLSDCFEILISCSYWSSWSIVDSEQVWQDSTSKCSRVMSVTKELLARLISYIPGYSKLCRTSVRIQVHVRRCSVILLHTHMFRYHAWAKSSQWYLTVLNLKLYRLMQVTNGMLHRA